MATLFNPLNSKRFCYTPPHWLKQKQSNPDHIKCWWWCSTSRTFSLCWGNTKCPHPFTDLFGNWILLKLNACIAYDLAIILLSIYPSKNAHVNASRSWCKNITSSIICNNLKLEITQVPITVECWESHMVRCYTAIQMNEWWSWTTTWRNLSN